MVEVLDEVGDESDVEHVAKEGAVADGPDVEGAAEETVEDAAADDPDANAVGDGDEAVGDDRSPKSGVGQSWQSD